MSLKANYLEFLFLILFQTSTNAYKVPVCTASVATRLDRTPVPVNQGGQGSIVRQVKGSKLQLKV